MANGPLEGMAPRLVAGVAKGRNQKVDSAGLARNFAARARDKGGLKTKRRIGPRMAQTLRV
jgi:hypothetical protein